MTKHHLSGVFLAGLMLVCTGSTTLVAQDKVESKPAAAENPKADMKAINRVVRSIGRFVKNPGDAAAPMADVTRLQTLVIAAKAKMPRRIAAMKKEEQAAMMLAYKKEMNVMLRSVLDLEDAMGAKDWAKAKAALSAMNKSKSTGHKQFKGRARRK